MKLGIDIGSTTVKLILADNDGRILYSRYERHMSDVMDKLKELMLDLHKQFGEIEIKPVITGSGGLALANLLGIKFEQEVIACSRAVEELIPQTDVAIELGGEDAKITYYGKTVEQRMNSSCAGGTGAFIDQMAILLNTDANGLNEAAKNYNIIYPIAARCGVFAKTDIQPLINDGAAIGDLAASIFQAVVNQTISGLACGRTIRGNVAFLGGPLSFMSELRKRFIETLGLEESQVIFPDDSKFFVAIGAEMLAEEVEAVSLTTLLRKIEKLNPSLMADSKHIDALFHNQEEYDEFKARHDKDKVNRKDIKEASGPVFLGIDAGSTTTKAALIDNEGNLLYSFYQGNGGNPTETTRNMLLELYDLLPETAYIAGTTTTGYGEQLIKFAFHADHGEIETMAHFRATQHFLPNVDFILDIGGQDMKCMKIKDNAIYNIMLNEACSSGCGSFLETYAKSVNLDTRQFAKEALFAENPVDLGTRCTVFMNSKVKQAQKEGAGIGDISAGLSYSVIKNALYKVIKLRNASEAGENIVVQGGTFLNDAVLRSLELIMGKNVVRPDIAGLMGAYGCALISQSNFKEGDVSAIMKADELRNFHVVHTNGRCNRCENRCILTINKFGDGSKFITGNRCERGAGIEVTKSEIPDLYEYKTQRLFGYLPLSEDEASRGTIGIPRVLNMYEDFPFWFTLLTEMGFRVLVSPQSGKKLYEDGMDTISSDTACYPAKIVHGHIKWLLKKDIKTVFYPCINYEVKEDKNAPSNYNCPIVATYAEVIANNMTEQFEEAGAKLMHPFLPYDNDKRLLNALVETFKEYNISRSEIKNALRLARQEQEQFKEDVRAEGQRAINYAREHGKKIICLAGRPYHLDPEINHGINRLITGFDFVVITEDSVSDLGQLPRPLRVLDQWVYHSRLYKAADFVGKNDDIELIQLNSFGCGLDAVTTDQIEEICNSNNKIYTVLKIDEVSNLGAIKIRIRSLKAAMEEREKNGVRSDAKFEPYERVLFTEEMRENYTILVPQMSPIHFTYFSEAMKSCGYNVDLLPAVDENSVNEGLRYINNDACYPTIVTLGQIISALKSGKYDLNKTAVFMSQTGGGCRASNYVSLLRKALTDLDMPQVPVVSFNMVGLEKNPGFKITFNMGFKLLLGAIYGDLMMRLLYATRPYEAKKGSTEALLESWHDRIIDNILNFKKKDYEANLKKIVEEFDNLERLDIKKPKVGVVGEILVKYHPNANNGIVDIIEDEGGEAVVLDLLDFFLYGMYSKQYNLKYLSGKFAEAKINQLAIKVIEMLRKPMRKALRESKHYTEPGYIHETAEAATKVISLGNQCGEGWLLTGEMIELIHGGAPNIVCLQPFACLPNHVTGKGVMKSLREMNPYANIAAIDYDPGASDVNQLNRIKLMMTTARKNFKDAN